MLINKIRLTGLLFFALILFTNCNVQKTKKTKNDNITNRKYVMKHLFSFVKTD